MNTRIKLKSKLPRLGLLTWMISPLLIGYSSSVFSWCALNKEFTTVSNSACAIDLEQCDDIDCPNVNLSTCNDTNMKIQLGTSLPELKIRGSRYQPEGYPVIQAQSLSLEDAFPNLLLFCFGDNKDVTYTWRKASNNAPEIISVAGESAFNSNGSGDTDIGIKVNIETNAGTLPLPAGNSLSGKARINNNGLADGVHFHDLGRLKMDSLRALNHNNQQNYLTDRNYAELEISYYSSDQATTPSKAIFNVQIGNHLPIAHVNTCGVSNANPGTVVNLGIASPADVKNYQAPIVPFSVRYECDGAINQQASLAFRPLLGTSIVDQNKHLIRQRNSTSEGVGIAFSKNEAPFQTLKWLHSSVCGTIADNHTGFCSKPGAITDEWISVNPTIGGIETFYAQMQPISPSAQIKAGTVKGKVMVILTHN